MVHPRRWSPIGSLVEASERDVSRSGSPSGGTADRKCRRRFSAVATRRAGLHRGDNASASRCSRAPSRIPILLRTPRSIPRHLAALGWRAATSPMPGRHMALEAELTVPARTVAAAPELAVSTLPARTPRPHARRCESALELAERRSRVDRATRLRPRYLARDHARIADCFSRARPQGRAADAAKARRGRARRTLWAATAQGGITQHRRSHRIRDATRKVSARVKVFLRHRPSAHGQ